WLATFGGLVRFDGLRFTVFDRGTDGIDSQRVQTLLEDSQGTLWAGTEDGMLIRCRDGVFSTLGSGQGVPDAAALRLDEAADGSLWATWTHHSTREIFLTRYDGSAIKTFHAGDLPMGVGPPSTEGVNDLWWSRDAQVWWSRDEQGLHCLVGGEVSTCVPSDSLPDRDVVRVCSDDHGHLWVVFDGGGVLQATPSTQRVATFDDSNGPPADAVTFLDDRAGTVWFGRIGGGVFTHRAGITSMASTVAALALFEDREGAVWVGSQTGLHRLRPQPITMLDEGDGLTSNLVYSVFQDRAGGIWLGTWGGGLQHYSGATGETYSYLRGSDSDRVTCIYQDRSGRIWVGSQAGLSYLSDGQLVRDSGPHADRIRAVWAMHEDDGGTFWLATDTGLVARAEGTLRRYTTADGLPSDRITALSPARAGGFWIGTYQGLARFDEGRFTTYAEADGFVGNWVRALHEDGDGVLWAGTYDGGLYRLRDGVLTRYTTREGLHDNGVFQILEDDFGFFWMGSNRGISRVSRQELNDFADGRVRSIRSRAFGIRDGMTTLECNGGRQPAGLRRGDGTLWFPTMGGVAVVDPTDITRYTDPPPVILEDRFVAGAPAPRGTALTVPSDATGFEVRYTAASFGAPEQVRYRYMLSGLDTDWVAAGDRRSVTYGKIPPGRYEFRVTAANEESDWNPNPQTLQIVVLAPFWRQPWFTGVSLAGMVALIVGVERRRAAQHRDEQARQAAFAQRLIQTQEHERQRLSTELHDALGQELFAIRAHVRVARTQAAGEAGQGTALDRIDEVARKASTDLKTIAHALRPYHLDKIGLARSIAGMTQTLGDACGIEFVTEVEHLDDLLDANQRIQAYRIVQECVSNVVKHSGATSARVVMSRRGDTCEIRVTDDGHGLPSGGTGSTDTPGLGLMMIRERARGLGGRVVLETSDGQGTSVVTTFPLVRTP
ncbi:MAG: two-component regulator propeller domain-containing protein, partial [Vicinamibacterales bacterium]